MNNISQHRRNSPVLRCSERTSQPAINRPGPAVKPLAVVWWEAGAPRLDLAKRFVAFASSSRSLANLTGYISYSPQRQSAMALAGKHLEVGIDMKPHLPRSPENTTNAVMEDAEWWADNQGDMNERFAAWLLK